jgi:hypothetical protein
MNINLNKITQEAFVDELNKIATDVTRFAKMWMSEAKGMHPSGTTVKESLRGIGTTTKDKLGNVIKNQASVSPAISSGTLSRPYAPQGKFSV